MGRFVCILGIFWLSTYGWPRPLLAADDPSVLPLPLCTPKKAPVTKSPAFHIPVATQDSFPMTVIAELEFAINDGMAFGDTDHDGRNEVVLQSAPSPYYYRILEEQGNNIYSMEYTGASLIPYVTGDLDRDGRSEIVGQAVAQVQVYESADGASYPTQLVWSSPNLTNVAGWTAIGDTDRDGRMEIIHSENYLGGGTCFLDIFENTSNDTFAPVFRGTISGQGSTGKKVITDLDGDGRLEIALCGTVGWLHVFESTCNNTWELTCRLWTGMFNAYSVSGGRDTDGNGKAELFVLGNVLTDSTAFFATMVYESSSDNSFQRIATIPIDQGTVGVVYNALGNLDSAGPDEYLTSTDLLRIFRATAQGQWDLIGTSTHRGADLYTFDVNRNGRPEVITRSYPTTLLLEYRQGTADSEPDPSRWSRSVLVVPNPCRFEAVVQFAPTVHGVTLGIFDVAGRLVERRAIAETTTRFLWSTQHLSKGIYFLRLQDDAGSRICTFRL